MDELGSNGSSVVTMVTQAEIASWTAGLDEVQRRIGPRFARSE